MSDLLARSIETSPPRWPSVGINLSTARELTLLVGWRAKLQSR